MSDVGLAIQRAEDKTLQLQARASAVDELLASGALEDPSGMYKDDITRELDALASDSVVEDELAALKAQLTGAPAPRAEISAPGNGTTASPAPPVEAQQPAAQPAPGESGAGVGTWAEPVAAAFGAGWQPEDIRAARARLPGVAIGTGVVEAIWSLVALQRWFKRRRA